MLGCIILRLCCTDNGQWHNREDKGVYSPYSSHLENVYNPNVHAFKHVLELDQELILTITSFKWLYKHAKSHSNEVEASHAKLTLVPLPFFHTFGLNTTFCHCIVASCVV